MRHVGYHAAPLYRPLLPDDGFEIAGDCVTDLSRDRLCEPTCIFEHVAGVIRFGLDNRLYAGEVLPRGDRDKGQQYLYSTAMLVTVKLISSPCGVRTLLPNQA